MSEASQAIRSSAARSKCGLRASFSVTWRGTELPPCLCQLEVDKTEFHVYVCQDPPARRKRSSDVAFRSHAAPPDQHALAASVQAISANPQWRLGERTAHDFAPASLFATQQLHPMLVATVH